MAPDLLERQCKPLQKIWTPKSLDFQKKTVFAENLYANIVYLGA